MCWYNFEKSDFKDTWSALFLCKKGELVQLCIEKGLSLFERLKLVAGLP